MTSIIIRRHSRFCFLGAGKKVNVLCHRGRSDAPDLFTFLFHKTETQCNIFSIDFSLYVFIKSKPLRLFGNERQILVWQTEEKYAAVNVNIPLAKGEMQYITSLLISNIISKGNVSLLFK